MSFLLDTDVCSAYLKGNAKVAHKVVQHGGRLHVSTVSVGELWAWGLRSKAPSRRGGDIAALLSIVTILVVSEPVAYKFGELQAGLRDQGQPAPGLDMLIAATAIVHGFTLVTHNTKDYARIPGLNLLDWLAP